MMISPLTALILSLLALLLAPLLLAAAKRSARFLDGVDAYVLVTIGGIVALHILPHTLSELGIAAAGIMLASLFLPSFVEKLRGKIAENAHALSLSLALLGIALHAFSDGMALSHSQTAHGFHGQALPLAVILHRIPDGIMIWWLTHAPYGKAMAFRTLGIMATSTVLGFVFGENIFAALPDSAVGIFEAIVGGSLLHVIFHGTPQSENSSQSYGSFTGVLAGFITVFLILSQDWSHSHDVFALPSLLNQFYMLAAESAPALVLAYFAAGVLHSLLPRFGTTWLASGPPISQALKGMLFGLPLPICSCGVVPIYRALAMRGVPLSAGLAFFVATPEFGLDALILSVPLLGWKFALIRVCAAVLIAFLVAIISAKFFGNSRSAVEHPHKILDEQTPRGWKAILKSGFMTTFDDTAPWILVGLGLATFCAALLDSQNLTSFASPTAQVFAATVIGIPLYICASGATPLVAVLMSTGLSPGAALCFLITGPATNVTSFGVLSQLHGKKLAFGFLFTLFAVTVTCGLLINAFWGNSISVPAAHNLHHHAHPTWLQNISLLILLCCFGFSIWRKGPRKLMEKVISFEALKPHTHTHSIHGHHHTHPHTH